MSHSITPSDPPFPYQVIVTTMAPPESKKPNYCADVDPKKKVKSYKPKNLSKNLFFDLKFATALLLAPIHKGYYIAGFLTGLAKPFIDWKYRSIIPAPKKLAVDAAEKDFGQMSRKSKLTYATVALLGPVAIAAATRNTFLSKGIVFFGGLNFCQELAQRAIRWCNQGKLAQKK